MDEEKNSPKNLGSMWMLARLKVDKNLEVSPIAQAEREAPVSPVNAFYHLKT